MWNLPTILGLALAALGLIGLIALRPQLTVTPGEQIESSEPLQPSFRITNSGLLAVHGVKVAMYAHHVELGPLVMDRNIILPEGWEAGTLDRGETATMTFKFVKAGFPPAKADIVIVVDYRPFRIHFARSRRYFRFVGQHGDNWQWFQQPSAEIQAEADATVNKTDEIDKKLGR